MPPLDKLGWDDLIFLVIFSLPFIYLMFKPKEK